MTFFHAFGKRTHVAGSESEDSDVEEPPVKKITLDDRVDSMMSSLELPCGATEGVIPEDATTCAIPDDNTALPSVVSSRVMGLVETETDYRYGTHRLETTGPWFTRAKVHLEPNCDSTLKEFLDGEIFSAASDLLFKIPTTDIKHDGKSYQSSRVVMTIPNFNRYDDVPDHEALHVVEDEDVILTFLPDCVESEGVEGSTKYVPVTYCIDLVGTVKGGHRQAVYDFNTSTSPDLTDISCKIELTSSLFGDGEEEITKDFEAQFVGSRMYFNVVSLIKPFDDHLKFCYMESVEGDASGAGDSEGAPRGRARFGYHHEL